MITLAETLAQLQSMGDPRAVASFVRLGMGQATDDEYYGCGLTKLKTFAKEFIKKHGRSHELAHELWRANVHDAKLFACFIDEPKRVTKEDIAWQSAGLRTCDVADSYGFYIVATSTFYRETLLAWTHSDDGTYPEEMKARAAFMTLFSFYDHKSLTHNDLMALLAQIRRDLQTAPNWVKDGMNGALMGIGTASPALNAETQAVCRALGPIKVDYGDTSCKTPNALGYITSERTQAKLVKAKK